jgi:hypothetical protein
MVRTSFITVVALLVLVAVCHGFSGLVQAGYTDARGEDAYFAATAARLKAQAEITEKITVFTQFDIAKEPELLDAYVEYSHSKLLNARLGQFKLPFGFETQASKYDLEAINRSLVIAHLWSNGVSRSYVRDAGLALMGRWKLLEYKVGAVNGVGYNYTEDFYTEGGSQLGASASSGFTSWGKDNNNSKDIVGRVGVGIPMFAGLGFSFYEGKWPVYSTTECDCDRSAKAFDLYLDTGKVLVQYEHIWAQGSPSGIMDINDAKYGGYYVVVGYRATPLIEPVWKVDILDPDKDADGDRMTDMYFGMNLNFQKSARFQLFYRESKVAKKYDDSVYLARITARF